MTQTASLKKINPAFNLFGFTFKKSLGFTALASIIVLIFSTFSTYSSVNLRLEHRGDGYIFVDYIPDILLSQACILAVICCIFFAVLLIINFNYLYSKSASDMFHAMPLTRNELLFSRFSATFVSSLIPLVIGYIGFIAITFIPKVEADISVILTGFGYTVLMMLLCGAFALIPIISAGNTFDSIVGYLCLNLGPVVIVALLQNICANTWFGYYASAYGIYGIAQYANPYLFSVFGLVEYFGTADAPLPLTAFGVIIVLLLIVALFAICAYLYNNRKSETAGGAYAFKFMPVILGFMVSFVCYFFLGEMFGMSESIALGVIGALLGGAIYNVITNRGFKKILPSFIVSACAIVTIILATLAIHFDVFGYQKYVPKADDIKEVYVMCHGAHMKIDGDKSVATNLHQKIITAYLNGELDTDNYLMETTVAERQKATVVQIEYKLKDGRTVIRRYKYIPPEIAAKEMTVIINQYFPNTVRERNLEDFGGNMFEISFNAADGQYCIYELTRAEAQQIEQAYIKDIQKTVVDADWNDGVREYYIGGTHTEIKGDGEMAVQNYSLQLRVHSDYTNTRQVIESLNLSSRENLFKTDEK